MCVANLTCDPASELDSVLSVTFDVPESWSVRIECGE